MPLIVTGAPPIHWMLAGVLIAAVTLVLLYVGNRRLGLSSGFEDLCSLVLNAPYFRRGSLLAARHWRLPFLAGLVLGGFLSAALAHGWTLTWAVPMLDRALPLGPIAKLAWMFVGGLFIGFGTRLAGGCTSGHGIFGIANLERSSVLTTMAFMASGILTTQLLYRVVLR
jgi:uncharacterized membrane protein YedE/YeeE